MIAEQKIKTGFILAAVLLLVMAAGAAYSVRTFHSASDLALHTLQVRAAIREILAAVQDVETVSRGFVLTGQDEALKTIPVVMLTSSREEADVVRSYDLGVNACVVKPVDFQHFIDAVKQLGVFWAVLTERPPGGAHSPR